MKRSIAVFFGFVFGGMLMFAQVIETEPGIPTMSQPINIYFNTDKLDASHDLYQFEGDLYAHTGVSIAGVGKWQNVIESWGNNTTQPQFSYLGSYRYKLEISPDIEHFYPDEQGNPIASGVVVEEICLVVRNADADKQTADKFIEIYEAGLEVNISSPEGFSVVVEKDETIDISVSAAFADSVSLYIDDKWIKSEIDSDVLTYSELADTYGGKWIKAVAWDLPESVRDSVYYYVAQPPVVEALPAGLEDGINYTSSTSATLVLTAPGKTYAYLVGDFNNWIRNEDSYMKITPDGEKFWLDISNLSSGEQYRFQYVVDGISIADPYAELILDERADPYIDSETFPGLLAYPVGLGIGQVSVLQTDEPEYAWESTGFTAPAKTDLVIYELLLRDFLAKHNYSTLIDTLPYLAKLGVNAIELMPVNEFDGNESWGYNPSFYFAPDKYYGTKNKLKEFIDSCHIRGIAVILDVVLNHATGSSPMAKLYWDAGNNKTAADNPWFNVDATHDFNVFHDFNHDSEYTRYHAKRVMSHWIEEYKVDGYRFDLSKGFTQNNTVGNVSLWGQYDANRIALWKMYADHIWSLDSDFYVILEHFAENSEETELANYGMMPWASPWVNGKMQYHEASMGYASDISWYNYAQRGWTMPNLVSYMESHDEERMMYHNKTSGNSSGSYDIKELNTGLERVILTASFFFTVPGPKMIWQFGELGYDHSIDFNGRTGNKPIRWDFLSVPERKTVNQAFSALIGLKTSEPAFNTGSYTLVEEGKMKRIEINHESMDVRILGNFDVSSGFLSGEFSKTGRWYEFFSGDSLEVTNTTQLMTLAPGEYRLYTTKRFEKPKFAVSVHDLLYNSYDNSWFSIYPNPANDIITIDPGEEAGGRVTRIQVLGLDGRVLLDENEVPDNRLDLSTLARGVYLIKVDAGKRTGTKRILKTN